MDTIECIRTRMSIRKFKPEPVSEEMLLKVIETAQCSPSYKNSQPWEVAIVSGEKKDALSKILIDLLERGVKPAPDLPEPGVWPAELDKRIRDLLKRRSEKFGIDLSNPDLIKKAKTANFRFYGAPHAVFLFQDSSLSPWSILDMGMFAQSLMLTAHAMGLGTVPQAFLTDYSKEVKSFLQVDDSKRLILGISIGYPDLEDKANSFKSTRIDTKEILRWVK
ncbi:MAG: nitroreductase [Nitrospirae bacterium]|nr:nitroreductase [Nitrospirota bacterium]